MSLALTSALLASSNSATSLWPDAAKCKGVMPHVVLGIDLGLVGQQQFRHVLVALNRRHVQRRPAVVVLAENQIRIVFEQRLDLFQVAILGRVMNLAAEGETAPGQRDQHDGGEAENWGVAESVNKACILSMVPPMV